MDRDFATKRPAAAGEELWAVLYVRVGAEAQAEAEATGPDLSAQRETCRERCERHGFEMVESGERR